MLALSFAVALVATPIVARFGLRARSVTAPLAVAVLAVACVAAALALQSGGPDVAAGANPGGDRDDAYYPTQ